MGNWLAKQSAVAVILARSPKDTVAGVMEGRASSPHAAQLLVRRSEMATMAKEKGAIAAVASLKREFTCQD
jgi:hypothetical protein